VRDPKPIGPIRKVSSGEDREDLKRLILEDPELSPVVARLAYFLQAATTPSPESKETLAQAVS